MPNFDSLLLRTERGLYCPAGDFHIDPTTHVDRAVVTHAHADHARWGSRRYLASKASEALLRMRLGDDAEFQFLQYGESIRIRDVKLSLHPAGHILGSAQVRIEHRGKVAVVTGDYKLGEDPTCQSWEAVRCHLMVTESTFGLPIYQWPDPKLVRDEINAWWRRCREEGTCCVLYGYAVGKSQSLLAGLDRDLGPIYTHGAVEKGNQAYRLSGVDLPDTLHVGTEAKSKRDWAGAMVLAVPSAHGTAWLKRFGTVRTAMASGWMAVRGSRRRRAMDRGFVFSDHVDWKSLLDAVEACNPETVWVTHGYAAAVARFLNEQGRDALAIDNRMRSEDEEDAAASTEVVANVSPSFESDSAKADSAKADSAEAVSAEAVSAEAVSAEAVSAQGDSVEGDDVPGDIER